MSLQLRAFIALFILFLVVYVIAESNELPVTVAYLGTCALFMGIWYWLFRTFIPTREQLAQYRWVFVVLIVAGTVGMLVYTFHSDFVNQDGMRNVTMAKTFLEHGDFKEYFRETDSYEWSHRYSPMMPLYLAGIIGIAGNNVWAMKVGAVALFALVVYIAYRTTKRMYGRDLGLVAAGLCAFIPRFWESTANLQTECMAVALYILIIYFILRSLEKQTEHYIIYAGLCAGLGYLTRSSIGYFFVISGVMGFLWRFYYMRWEVFKNRSYLIAIACFLSLVAIWASRNLYRFWDGTPANFFVAWQTDAHLSECSTIAFRTPLLFLFVLAVKVVWIALLAAPWWWFNMTALTRFRQHILDERVSGMALAIFLPVVIGVVISTIFTLGEGFAVNPIFNYDNNRYILMLVIPLFWYGFEMERLEGSSAAGAGSGSVPEVRHQQPPPLPR